MKQTLSLLILAIIAMAILSGCAESDRYSPSRDGNEERVRAEQERRARDKLAVEAGQYRWLDDIVKATGPLCR